MLVLLVMLLFGTACAREEDSVSQEERQESQAAYEELLGQTPDSVLARMSPLDTLFLNYRADVTRPHRVDTAAARRWVDSVLAALTLDEKIGQLFIIELPASSGLRSLVHDRAREAVEAHGVGGFLVSRLLRPREVFDQTQRLQRLSKVPLLFAADYERGAGRFNNAYTELPSNMALGAARDTFFAAAAGRLSAIESRAIGINLLFAPVVDVNNNPDNPIINIRSYGEDPVLVGHMAAAFVHEAESHGVLTTLKHFPGHGDTSVDSHARMGVIEGSRAALDSVELRPYRVVLNQPHPPAGIMTAHLWIRALEAEPLPATFSRRVLHHLLRDTLGFDGFVVTDDVKMGALQGRYTLEDRIVRPLLAGADIILTPASLEEAVRVLKGALQQGRIQEADIDRAVRRILFAKATAGLHENPLEDRETLDYLLEEPRGAFLAQAIADRALTLLKTAPILPLRPDSQRIAVVQLSNYRNSESIEAAMDAFVEQLEGEVDEVRFDRDPSRAAAADVIEQSRRADVVVLGLYLRLQSGRGEAGLFPAQQRLVRSLLELDQPVVLVTFGNPYAVTTFQEAEAHLVAYDQTLESVRAAARILRGLQPPQGKLPITVDPYPYGSGLDRIE